MKNTSKYLALCITTIIFASSCKKNNDEFTPEEDPIVNQQTNTPNIQAMFNNMATPLETHTAEMSTYNTFICSNGTSVTIYPNAFLTQSGNAVTGIVNIEVKDVLNKKDMILNNAIPVSNGQLLVSGGEVYLNATQNGQKLKINPSSAVYLKVPIYDTPSNQMLEFYASGPSNLSNSSLNWATSNTATTTIEVTQDSIATGPSLSYYSFQVDSLNWTNCDYFRNPGVNNTTCTVNLTGFFTNSNAAVFISMNGVNALARLHDTFTTVSQSFSSYVNSLPEGLAYTIIAISFDGTNYYYASQTVTMTTDMVINMPALTQTTKSQIESNLSTLP